MNVLVHLSAARRQMGGGALSMVRLAHMLADAGHSVRVTATQVMEPRVFGLRADYLTRADVEWSDVVLTVAGPAAAPALRGVRRTGKPLVQFVHSAVGALHCDDADLLVWGSAALQARVTEQGKAPAAPGMVLWPPFDVDAVWVEKPGECVTLVNLMPEKGAHLFWRIAERMSDVPFLGVVGGWNLSRQVVPASLPANAEVMRHAKDPRAVYARTKVLLYMRGPDAGPDWLNGVGLTAMEAAVSGIPTIAHPGPGLRESLADGATWVDSDDPAEWEGVIRGVLAAHGEHSRAALRRAAMFDPEGDFKRLTARLEEVAARAEVLAPC